jgi:hypothetical protein
MTKNGILIICIAIISVIVTGAFMINNQKKKVSVPPLGESTISITPDTVVTAATVQEVSEITLSVISPLSGTSVTSANVAIKGKTLPKAEVFANEAESVADGNGNFSLTVALDEGENSIIVTAIDSDGNVAEKEILVTYTVAE